MWKVRLFGYAEVTVTRKCKEKQAFPLHFTRFSVTLQKNYTLYDYRTENS
jgi:hypothetical protein